MLFNVLLIMILIFILYLINKKFCLISNTILHFLFCSIILCSPDSVHNFSSREINRHRQNLGRDSSFDQWIMFDCICVFGLIIQLVVLSLCLWTPCMEEQNHSLNESNMANPAILSVFIYFCNSYFNVYFALYVFMIEWWINKQTNEQTNNSRLV